MIQAIIYSDCCDKEALVKISFKGIGFYYCSKCKIPCSVHEYQSKRESFIRRLACEVIEQYKNVLKKLSKV